MSAPYGTARVPNCALVQLTSRFQFTHGYTSCISRSSNPMLIFKLIFKLIFATTLQLLSLYDHVGTDINHGQLVMN